MEKGQTHKESLKIKSSTEYHCKIGLEAKTQEKLTQAFLKFALLTLLRSYPTLIAVISTRNNLCDQQAGHSQHPETLVILKCIETFKISKLPSVGQITKVLRLNMSLLINTLTIMLHHRLPLHFPGQTHLRGSGQCPDTWGR